MEASGFASPPAPMTCKASSRVSLFFGSA